MQYCIWAEMHVGGYQPSLDEAPSNSMFLRAGGAATKRRTTADIVSQAINQLAPALSPGVAAPTSHSSLAKLINNRSKCYNNLESWKIWCRLEYCLMKSIVMKERPLWVLWNHWGSNNFINWHNHDLKVIANDNQSGKQKVTRSIHYERCDHSNLSQISSQKPLQALL